MVMVKPQHRRGLRRARTRPPMTSGFAEILAALPPGGLLVCALGWFSVLWCDDVTHGPRFFVTRRREKTAHRTGQVLSQGGPYRDDILQVGQYCSHPWTPPRRMVSVLGPGAWYRSVTNGRDPQALSARRVCEWYRRRWRIEEAFALTTRRLDVAYVWTGSTPAVQWPIHATLIFYPVLVTICQQVAQALANPGAHLGGDGLSRLHHDSRPYSVASVTIWYRFWPSTPNSLGLSNAGASSTTSVSNWSPSLGRSLS
jgi:hypothetical protein